MAACFGWKLLSWAIAVQVNAQSINRHKVRWKNVDIEMHRVIIAVGISLKYFYKRYLLTLSLLDL